MNFNYVSSINLGLRALFWLGMNGEGMGRNENKCKEFEIFFRSK